MPATADASPGAGPGPSTADAPLIEVKGVCQEFPAREDKAAPTRVLTDISFAVTRPGTICLLGPSGCGKSTILRLVSGMYDRYVTMPTSGEVRIAGRLVCGPHDDVLTVFQRPVLKAWLNVRKNVMLPFKARLWGKKVPAGERAARVDEALEAVGLADSAGLSPRQLSGGMQQRVALAARLVLRPPILCLDEPFSALDPQTREEMQELVIRLWVTYPCVALFVTHDVTEALRVADRIMVLSTRPASIVADLTIAAPKPRDRAWLLTSEVRDIERLIIRHIREAATGASQGSLKMDV
jgi:ABC-type nitrate/sulfonate/bicarbonate transport system ATPase subunit